MELAVLLDIPDIFRSEAIYVIENIFFPFHLKVFLVESTETLKHCQGKIIYCHGQSPYLVDPGVPPDTLFVLLEDWTLSYFFSGGLYRSQDVDYRDGIPFLFPLRKNDLSKKMQNVRVFPFDIFAASFFFLSCWQEYTIGDRDWKGRVPLASTLSYKLGIHRFPIVNKYLGWLSESVAPIWGEGFRAKLMPGDSSIYVAMSHDVDYIDWAWVKYLKFALRKSHFVKWCMQEPLSFLQNLCGKRYIFSKMISMERKYGASSTYFFLSNYLSEKHGVYAQNLMGRLEKQSFEVGHHISDQSISGKNLRADRNEFMPTWRPCGSRVHTLRFEIHSLYSLLEACGYLYDSSLLFPEDLGYRTGFSYPHYIFDPVRKRAFDVMAIPLNVMDGTLVDNKYLGLDDWEAENELKTFIESIIPFGGAVCILLHNNFFYVNTKSRFRLFDSLLQYLRDQEVRIGTCQELYDWRKGDSAL